MIGNGHVRFGGGHTEKARQRDLAGCLPYCKNWNVIQCPDGRGFNTTGATKVSKNGSTLGVWNRRYCQVLWIEFDKRLPP
jgi:hypothetical protein